MTIGYCPSCGTMRAPGAMFCTGCGSSFQALMAPCPTCGQLWMPTGAPAGSPASAAPAVVAPVASAVVAAESFLPRGPIPGDDYSADRDCGNCGAILDPLANPCASCGSRNTGDTFLPHLLA